MRKHPWFFLTTTAAALALRILFILRFPGITSDSFIYGDIAKNWLQHGIYGLGGSGGISETYIRLPGYPAFLAGVFAVFGMEHYRAALFLQMFADLGTCLLIADLARRLVSPHAARAAFLLAAICPFLADYAAAALTETLEIFFTTLALDLAVVGLENLAVQRVNPWVGSGLAVGAAILLRPDGGLLLAAIEFYLLALLVRNWAKGQRHSDFRPLSLAFVVVGLFALSPLVPWTLRNWHTFHRFEPLAPRYANEEGEYVPTGFNRWVKTWIADYTSTEEVYWVVPGATVDPDILPSRAFDSERQREQTRQLIYDYNASLHVTPALDSRFVELAAQRIHDAPWRYYVWLPAVRVADMWLRPRTEKLPSNSRWWEFDDDPKGMALAIALGIINLGYVSAAVLGLIRGRFAGPLGLLLIFVILRSVFLGTLENPETRYTLECYPVVIVLAGAFVGGMPSRNDLQSPSKKR